MLEKSLDNSTVTFCNDLLGYPGDETIFNMSLLSNRDVAAFSSTMVEGDDSLPPDQDHNDILKEENELTLQTKIMSLKLELQNKESTINEQSNEIDILKVEVAELSEKFMESEKTKKELQESLECAMIRANSIETQLSKVTRENKLFSTAIKKLTSHNSNQEARNVKDGSSTNSEVEKRCRLLGQRVAELEAQSGEASSALEHKLKKVNDNLNAKTKELKNKNTELKKAEKNVIDLTDKLNASKKLVSELENSNARLKQMSELSKEKSARSKQSSQHKQSKEKSSPDRVSHPKPEKSSSGKSDANKSPGEVTTASSKSSRSPPVSSKSVPCSVSDSNSSAVKCRSDNVGKCHRGNQCRDKHAKRTCPLYSRFNFCNQETTCEYRHPSGDCYEWLNTGNCRHGDDCRFKHPIEWRPVQQEHFLGHQSPVYPTTEPGSNQWPRYSHHDLRGSRW